MLSKPDAEFRYGYAKLYLDFGTELSLACAMMLDDDEIGELPRRLFAMAGRRLERVVATAGAGEASGLAAQRQYDLAGELHGCGQDIMVIADAIAALAREMAS